MADLPSIRQLEYFLALCEHGHFGHAAEACFVSQSAFSHAIRELEQTVGAQLVDRNKRSVVITNTGRDIAVQARLCLQDVQALMSIANSRKDILTGPLVLGAIPTIAPFLLPRLIPKLRAAYPELQLFLREDKTEAVYRQLMDGTVDVIAIALPWPMRNTDTLELFRDPFHLAYSKNTELIDPKKFHINRLTAGSVILLDDGHCLRDHALSACRIFDMGKVHPFAASSLLTLLEMIDADLGVSFIPEMAINSGALKGTSVRTVPMPDKSYRSIGLAWRSGSARAEEFRLLGELMRKHA